jgi:hypothetical protein
MNDRVKYEKWKNGERSAIEELNGLYNKLK